MKNHYTKTRWQSLLVALLLVIAANGRSWGQAILYEDFNYTAGQNIGGSTNTTGGPVNNWYTHSNSQVGTIDVTAGSLNYPGLLASNGNKIRLPGSNTTTPRDVNRAISAASATVLYFSALINVVDNTQLSTTGDYFMHFGATSGITNTTFFARLSIKSVNSGANFRLAIQNSTGGTPTQTDNGTDLAFGTTYLLVVKYDLNGSNPDIATLWVNPSSLGGTEPAGGVVNSSGITGQTTFASICFRNSSGTPKADIDEVRVGTTYASVTPSVLLPDWANLQFPGSGTINLGDAYTVYAQVFEPGITNAAGQGAGITAEIGYSTSNTDPATWTNWVTANYNAGFVNPNNDEYMADLGAALAAVPVAPGTYYYASRFRIGTNPWVYGGFSSTNGGFWNGTTNISGVLTLNPPPQIGWCNLQWPASGSILEGGNYTVYAQVWKSGVTDSPGQGAGITASIGYSTTNTNPSTWTNWVPAIFNVDIGNNDEYMANIGPGLAAGTYYYASRFKLGLADYVYGGISAPATPPGGNFWDGGSWISGVLTVEAPVITVTPGALTGFTYYVGEGPSAEQSFTVAGTTLLNDIVVTAPANYEVSLTSGTGFGATVTLPEADGAVATTTVYVRLKAGLAIADYTGAVNVSASASGAGDQLVDLEGSVTAPPLPYLTITPAEPGPFSYVYRRGPSATQALNVSGINMVDTLIITAPANYEISLHPAINFGTELALPNTGSLLSAKTFYIRLKAGLAEGPYNGDLVFATTDMTDVLAPCLGTVLPPPPPAFTFTPATLTGFTYVIGTGPSYPQSFQVSGTDLLSDLYISTLGLSARAPQMFTPAVDYEISLNPASGYGTMITLTPIDGMVKATTVWVRLKGGLPIGNYNAEALTLYTPGAADSYLLCDGSVTPPIPTVLASAKVLNGFSYIVGNGPSATQKVIIEASNLTANLVATPPADYELSLVDNAGDVSAITFYPVNGIVPPTALFIRLKAGLPDGAYNNEVITLASAGAVTRTITCSGNVFTPTITLDVATADFGDQVVNTVSASKFFTVSGSSLTGPITVTPPDGFKISLTSGSGYSSAPLVINAVGGVVAPTIVYLVFSPTVVQPYTGNVAITSPDAASKNVAVTGKGVCPASLLPYAENFDYVEGSLLTANCWNAHSGVGTNSPKVTASTITYPGYLSSGIGNEASLTVTGEDVNRIFAPQSTGTVYFSFLVNVSSATTTGDYFFHVGQTNLGTTFRARVFVKKDASDKLAFGIAQSSTPNYSAFNYSLNTTYLVVLKFTVVDGATNDVSAIYINPALNAALPATGWIANTDASGTDLTELGCIALRQGSATNAANLKIDGIRVATAWTDIVGATGTVPAISATPATLTGFTYMAGSGPSAEQSFTVSGSNLADNISITAPADFEISKGTGAAFVAASPLVLNPTAGTVEGTMIYVRMKAGLAMGNYNSETINVTSPGAIAKTITCSGTVTAPVATIVAGTLTAFGNQTVNTVSAEKSYTVSGLNLTSGITITPPAGFLISTTSGSGYAATPVTLAATAGTVPATTIYVVFSPTAVQAYTGNITHEATGVTAVFVPVTGTGVCAPAPFAFVEDFSYPAASLLTDNCWMAHSAGGTNPVTVAPSSITFPGYLSSGVGNEVVITGSGEDVDRTFAPQGPGTYYFGFLVNVQSATAAGEYFFHLGQSVIGTTFRGRVFVKSDEAGKLAFGVAQSTSTPVYSGFDYDLNKTYLVVLKFKALAGDANDVSAIYINPQFNKPEPATGWVESTDASGTDLTELGSVSLRQGNAANAATLKLDGIRGSANWSDITTDVTAVKPVAEANAEVYSYQKTVYVTVKDNSKGNIMIYSIDGKLVHSQPATMGQSRIVLDVPGIYVVKVLTQKTTLNRKVYIQQ